MISAAQFFDFLERRSGEWRIAHRICIYQKHCMDCGHVIAIEAPEVEATEITMWYDEVVAKSTTDTNSPIQP